MFRNYFALAFRSLSKQKVYSVINVFGLSIGLASFFLIGLFVQNELEFDQFHEDADRIFKIAQVQPQNMYLGTNHFAVTPAPLPDALVDELPSVEEATQINTLSSLLTVDDTGFYEDGIWATESFFDVFTFPLLHGNTETVLRSPSDIVLTESLAERLFGTTDVLGEDVEFSFYDDPLILTVAGVIADVPVNSHIQFDYVMTFLANTSRSRNSQWGSNSYHTYVLLQAGVEQSAFDEDVKELGYRHMRKLSWIQENPERLATYYSQRLTDIHLRSRINFDIGDNGNIQYVWLFSAVALLILLTACINYMNLTTARAAMRAKEVGIRKVAGANRRQLIRQFLGEGIATSMLATFVSIGIVILVLPVLNDLLGRQLDRSELVSLNSISIILLTGLTVGLISGSYPALFLSGISPSRILKSGWGLSSNPRLRNILVVSQFAIGTILVVGTIVIQKQMAYVSEFDTGVDREQIVAVRIRDNDLRTDPSSILSEMNQLRGVLDVSSGNNLPIRIGSNSTVDSWEGAEETDEMLLWNTRVNFNYENLAGLELVAGDFFSEDRALDAEEGIVLNEAAVKALQWENYEAIGKSIEFRRRTRVTGVIKDFHFQSLHESIAPLALLYSPDSNSYLLLKIDARTVQETMADIENTWNRFAPRYPFDFQFMDDAFANQYETEYQLSSVLRMFTALSLIIACLGLFGLAAFAAQQRTREIGIRRVLGASSPSIVVLMSRDFGLLVTTALFLGFPIAYFVMNRWLDAFAYRTSIDVSTFAWVAAVTFILTLTSVGYQSIRASLSNPVESLRYE